MIQRIAEKPIKGIGLNQVGYCQVAAALCVDIVPSSGMELHFDPGHFDDIVIF